jgi:hypothetical protein
MPASVCVNAAFEFIQGAAPESAPDGAWFDGAYLDG